MNADPIYKDAALNELAEEANVAQFVSFDAKLRQRFAWIRGHAPNVRFASVEAAVTALLEVAPEHRLNIRSYTPEAAKRREFLYGLDAIAEVTAALRRLAAAGLYTIVNETLDVHDGGVSGVALGDLLEFAPGDTPRCVEKPGTAAMPRALGLRLLETVYGFRPDLDLPPDVRLEFSLHPVRRGFRREHTVLWEREHAEFEAPGVQVHWPNLFSRFVGDKAFGLLVAEGLGLPVPRTTVLARGIAPFRFGRATGTGETWIRTCPVEPVPGRFTTQRGWRDPFRLMSEEDPEGTALASVLAQESVEAAYSGALIATATGDLTIEGVRGRGDAFMLGQAPESLPDPVQEAVQNLYSQAATTLGPVRFEWVYDGREAWIVQLHRGATPTSGRTIYPGEAPRFHRFEVERGLEALRALISEVEGSGEGILLVGDVGVTSHLGDVLRRARIPSLLESSPRPDA